MKMNMIILIISCVLIIAVSIPLIFEKVKPNNIYGFRTSKTLSNEVVWYKANKFSGYALLIAAIVSLVSLLLKLFYPNLIPLSENPYFEVVVFTVPILISVVVSFIYVSKLP